MSRSIERSDPVRRPAAPVPEECRSGAGAVRNEAWDREIEHGFRGRWYSLSRDEVRILHDIAAFRVVEKQDLARFACEGQTSRFDRALSGLEASGFIQSRQIYSQETRSELELVTARSRATKFLRSVQPAGNEQEFFYGFVKQREALHDSAIYRMFALEAERIAREGGRVSHVVLDFELKRELFRRISARKEGCKESESEARRVVADELQLPMINDRIQLPDLRLEYTDAMGARAHVDLELATEHYKQSQLVSKAKAGFRIYTSAAGGVPQDERMMLRIFEI